MKKTLLSAAFGLSFLMLLTGCKTKVAPVSERIAKVWVALNVREGGSTVYSQGGTSNAKPGYSSYRLDLSNAPNVTLTEFEGTVSRGTYTIQNDNTLVLSGLTPEPTGTGGTLTYAISTLDDTQLVLNLSGAYPKTGNTNNTYTLIAN